VYVVQWSRSRDRRGVWLEQAMAFRMVRRYYRGNHNHR
jgi:hypothetical protein